MNDVTDVHVAEYVVSVMLGSLLYTAAWETSVWITAPSIGIVWCVSSWWVLQRHD